MDASLINLEARGWTFMFKFKPNNVTLCILSFIRLGIALPIFIAAILGYHHHHAQLDAQPFTLEDNLWLLSAFLFWFTLGMLSKKVVKSRAS